MQKKIIALAVAGLSTAAFAQTNVTIYGVADVSAQGYNMTSKSALPFATTSAKVNEAGKVASGGSFNLTNNSSLIGFKGTEDLGNGLKGLFQAEANVAITGGSGGVNSQSSNTTFNSLRDTYVGLSSKYGTVLGGYLSTPYRSALNSFDVMPGATGSGRIENMMGAFRLNANNLGASAANTASTGGLAGSASVRATALAYAMPTLYGFNGAIAYTGSSANGQNNNTGNINNASLGSSLTTATPFSALSLNLGWSGYGVDIKGAFQQAKLQSNIVDTTTAYVGASAKALTAKATTTTNAVLNLNSYTSYLIGAAYTGVPGLKAAVVYARNTLGTNATGDVGAMKGSNNQVWVGASYRFGNNEPRLSYVTTSNMSGLSQAGIGQDGGSQWTANWGYYLSKRTQVYGIVSGVKNNANGIWTPAGNGSSLLPTGGQSILTYGAGLRTNF